MDLIKVITLIIIVVFTVGCTSQPTKSDDGIITLIHHDSSNSIFKYHDNVDNVTIYTVYSYGVSAVPDYMLGKPKDYNPYKEANISR
jgi:hypothetical protein